MKAEIPGREGWNEAEDEYLFPPDNTLITASCGGDQRAFEEIYRRYRPHVWDLCQRMVGDPGWAEDLTQETFIRAYRRLSQFEQGRALWPWLATVARNICLDEMRVAQRRPLAGEKGDSEAPEEHTSDLTSEEAIARHERARLRVRVTTALATLHPSDRRVVLLRAVEGWTYKDIARHDGRSVHAVRNVAWRARGLLRARLDDDRRHLSGLGLLPPLFARAKDALARLKGWMTQTLNRELANTTGSALGEYVALTCIGIIALSVSLLSIGGSDAVLSTREQGRAHLERVRIATRLPDNPSSPRDIRHERAANNLSQEEPSTDHIAPSMPVLTVELKGDRCEGCLLAEKNEETALLTYTSPRDGKRKNIGHVNKGHCKNVARSPFALVPGSPITGLC